MGDNQSEVKKCSICGLPLKAEDDTCPRCGNVIHKNIETT
jgi:predicted RNA-binding Zn-ribbon protein involved in translation (DUF1610 family)